MATKLESIVASKFDGMPLWVRVIVYFMFVFTYIYLLLSPSYLDGKLVVIDEEGGEYAVRGNKQIVIWSDGRLIKVIPNEDGYWAVPIPSKIPFKEIDLSVLIGERSYSVIIPYSYVFSGKVKISYQEDITPHFKFVSSTSSDTFSLINSAFASDLDKNITRNDKNIEVTVTKALEQYSGLKDENSKLESYFNEHLLQSSSELSIFMGKLGRELNLTISDEQLIKTNNLSQFVAAYQKANSVKQYSISQDEILKIIKSIDSSGDIYTTPNIPEKKLNSARKSTSIPDDEQVLALIDTTLFGSATDCMLIGTNGIYYSTDWTRTSGPEKGELLYADLPTRVFTKKYLEVGLGNGQYFVLAGSGVKTDDLLEILNKFKASVVKGNSQ